MNIKKLTLRSPDYPEVLRHIPSKPQQLYHIGAALDDLLKYPRVTIVGSRNMTSYGRQTTRRLAAELTEQGIIIVSGLALGVDALAHQAALEAGGRAIAVLPSPLQNILPSTNRRLADDILNKGGAIVSEYAEGMPPLRQNFIARNRIMSGLGDAVLITEASEKSGSLHTARFALDQGRMVMAVPGNITQPGSTGANNLIKSSHAAAVTTTEDVLNILGLNFHKTVAKKVIGRNAYEQRVLDLILQGLNDGDKLLDQSGLTATQFNQVLTMLEIGGKILPLGANKWSIA